jgi:hypothetical protein
MVLLEIDATGQTIDEMRVRIQKRLMELDPGSIVRIRLRGKMRRELLQLLSAPSLRSLAPAGMNISTPFSIGDSSEELFDGDS